MVFIKVKSKAASLSGIGLIAFRGAMKRGIHGQSTRDKNTAKKETLKFQRNSTFSLNLNNVFQKKKKKRFLQSCTYELHMIKFRTFMHSFCFSTDTSLSPSCSQAAASAQVSDPVILVSHKSVHYLLECVCTKNIGKHVYHVVLFCAFLWGISSLREVPCYEILYQVDQD